MFSTVAGVAYLSSDVVISVQQTLGQQSLSTAHLNTLLAEEVKSVITQENEFPEVCVAKLLRDHGKENQRLTLGWLSDSGSTAKCGSSALCS